MASIINAREPGQAPTPAIVRRRGMRKELAHGRVNSTGRALVQSDQPMYYTFGVADDDQKQVTVALHPDALAAMLVSWEFTAEQLADAYEAARQRRAR